MKEWKFQKIQDINESVRLHELHGKLIEIGIDALSETPHDVC